MGIYNKQNRMRLTGAAKGTIAKAYTYGKAAYKAYKQVVPKKHKQKITIKTGGSQIIKAIAAGTTKSYTSVSNEKYKLPKIIHEITSPTTKETLTGFGVTSNENFQGVSSIPQWRGGLLNDLALTINNSMSYLNVLNTTLSSPSLQSGQFVFKVVLDHLNTITSFTNEGFSNIELEIYDVISKVNSDAYNSPHDSWSQGLANQSLGTFVSHLYPYAVPTTSKDFNITWKIVKKTIVELGSGRGHTHTFEHKCNKIFDSQMIYNYQLVKDVTTATMIVVRGTPADSSLTAAIGNVALSPVKLAVVQRVKGQVRMLSQRAQNTFQSSTLSFSQNLYVPTESGTTTVDVENTFA